MRRIASLGLVLVGIIVCTAAAPSLAGAVGRPGRTTNPCPTGTCKATITATCTEVTFAFTDFPATGTNHPTEKIFIDGALVDDQVFLFTGSSGSNTVAISIPPIGTHMLYATTDFGGQRSLRQTLSCGPPCPPGQKVNFRWHYSVDGSSGSWSGTGGTTCGGSSVSIGPQAMEGNEIVAPGTPVKFGYDFTLPGNNSSMSLTVINPTITFTLSCPSGQPASPSVGVLSFGTMAYWVTNSDWYPTGDQSSSAAYQITEDIPNACSGGLVSLAQGGTFTASVT